MQKFVNPELKVDGVLMTLVDARTTFSVEVPEMIRARYGGGIKIYENMIPMRIKAAEGVSPDRKGRRQWQMAVAVVDRLGSPLMPTTERKARILLKKGRAVIHKYRPMFTIRLTDREGGTTQPLEYKCDTGYQHIGISICTEKHEYVNAQYDMLPDEVERHNDCRKYRRSSSAFSTGLPSSEIMRTPMEAWS